MKPTQKSIIAIILLLFVVYASQAQSQCDLNVEEIVARVTEQCANMGENEVCYGNRNVVAAPRVNTVDFTFSNPGDIVSLSNVQSLFVSDINPANDEWGVAQMRLQVSSERGSQNVDMLLFGRFNIQNAVASSTTLPVSVITRQAEIYSVPDVTSLLLESPTTGTILLAHGRLEDNTWLQVENESSHIVGWVNAATVQVVNATQNVTVLPVRQGDSQYYGAMQAFTFTNGASDIGCDDLASDGLLIQTPEGVARVSLLINEVSIELTGGGAGVAGTAFVQANPEAETGMQVNVVQGQASVETADGSSQTLNTGQQSSIPMDENGMVNGAPSIPIQIDLSNIHVEALLPTFNFSAPTDTSSNTGTGNGSSIDFNPNAGSTGSSSNNNTGNSSGTNNGGTGSSSNNNSSGNSSGTIDINITGGSGNAPATPIYSSIEEMEAAQNAERSGGLTQGNIIALTLAVMAVAAVVGGIIFYTVSNKKR